MDLKLIIVTILYSLGIFTCANAYSKPDPNFHIYLMIGQSNMEGAAPIEDPDKSTHARVKVLLSQNCDNGDRYGTWREAIPPLTRCAQLGPGDTFGDVMAEKAPPNVTIGLVGLAYGGAQIESFLPECAQHTSRIGKPNACHPPYGDIDGAPRRGGTTPMYLWITELAKQAQQQGVIKGVIFHQGESDPGETDWPQKVNTLITSLRAELGLTDEQLPVLIGELPYDGCCKAHNELIKKTPSVISNSYVISAAPENGKPLALVDEYHWGSEAVRIMGRRYAEEMMRHIRYKPEEN